MLLPNFYEDLDWEAQAGVEELAEEFAILDDEIDIPVEEIKNESWADWLSRFIAAANLKDIIEGHLIEAKEYANE